MTKCIANIRLHIIQHEDHATVGVTWNCLDDGCTYGDCADIMGELAIKDIAAAANQLLAGVDDFLSYVPPVKKPRCFINGKEIVLPLKEVE